VAVASLIHLRHSGLGAALRTCLLMKLGITEWRTQLPRVHVWCGKGVIVRRESALLDRHGISKKGEIG
jgi:hypothetical protein